MSKYLDFINIMTYDFHGQWEKEIGHNSPLYALEGASNNQKKLTIVSDLFNKFSFANFEIDNISGLCRQRNSSGRSSQRKDYDWFSGVWANIYFK